MTTGNQVVAAGATLTVAGADSSRVVFAGTGATLLLDVPSQFSGIVSGFEQSDTIALAGVQATGVSITGDTLEVLSGSALIDSIALPADYGAADFSVVQSGNTALISETGITYSTEGPTWDSATVTWSFADSTYASDAGDGLGFSGYVTQAAEQAVFEQAFSEWSAITGLDFVETPDSSDPADIRIGWSDFSGGEIGEADFSYSGGDLLPDTLVRLEDPATDALTDSNGTLVYSGTESSLLQVALHEIGHAIGLDHTPDPAAIMNPTASAANRQLDASDIAGAQALYAADVPCYAAGTRLRTGRGDIAVEHLAVGDLLLSALTGAFVPVIWLGHRNVDCLRHPHRRHVWPVRVRADAFGEGVPARELVLSPDHAVCFGGVLIPIRHLIDGDAVTQIGVPQIQYWHVELARHDVLLAEGLPAESYLDTGNRTLFANGDAGLGFSEKPCLEMHLRGAVVMRARRHLRSRRKAMISVHLDGRLTAPTRSIGGHHRFLLPQGGDIVISSERKLQVLLNGQQTDQRHLAAAKHQSVLEVTTKEQ